MSTETGAPRKRSGAAQILSNVNYRLAWPAGLSSQMGRMMWTFVASYLVFELSRSAFLTSLVAVTFAAPQFLLGVVSGTLADSFDRRWMMIYSLIIMTALTFFMSFLAFIGRATAASILWLSLITGVLFTVNQVTKRTFTFDVVGRDLITNAMAIDHMAMTIGTILGPIIVGTLLGFAPSDPQRGTAWAFFGIALFDSLSAVLLLMIKPNWTQAKIPFGVSGVIRGTSAGLKVVGSSKALIGIMGITVLFNFVFPPHRTMIPVFGKNVLHIGPTLQGYLGAAQGIGSLVGAVYLAWRGVVKKQAIYYWVGAMIATGCLAVFAASHTFPLSFSALAVAGIGQTFFGTMQATLVLTSVADNMRGRVMGILSMAIGSQTLGSLLLGSMSDSMGAGPALLILALGGTLVIFGWGLSFRAMRRM